MLKWILLYLINIKLKLTNLINIKLKSYKVQTQKRIDYIITYCMIDMALNAYIEK